jgi:predicted nucleic acid-binding Zn finger protein
MQEEQRTDSFAEQQAKLARESAERFNLLGKDLFQVFQGIGLLNYLIWLAYCSCSQCHLDMVLLVARQVSVD